MNINIHSYRDLTPDHAIFKRAELDIADVTESILPIIQDVRNNGDAALAKYAKQFENANLDASAIKVTQAEIDSAFERVDPNLKAAIERSAARIRKFHQAQMPQQEEWWIELEDGVMAGEKTTPVRSIGLYVPRGKGCFPSVMTMLCTPATVAGIQTIAVMTPPTENGDVDDVSLVAASICGVTDIYKSGGAQGVAALKYGTETVPAVDKIIGPGNAYTSAAQRLLFGVNIGIPAGPSESIVIADEHATPQNVALDLLNEAEHGPDSCAVLVTHSQALVDKVVALIPDLVAKLPDNRKAFCETVLSNYGGIVITENEQQSIDFCNDFAAEHMVILTQDPEQTLKGIQHTGEALLGEYTPIVVANFNLGVNAILPTGRAAFCHSGTNMQHFLKKTSLGKLSKEAFERISPDAVILAEYEGFPGHANAIRLRDIG